MKHIFLDMDGTMCEYSDSVQFNRTEFEAGFFLNKRPLRQVIDYLEIFTYDLYVISASPSEPHDEEKYQWLKWFCPYIPAENIFITRWKEENKMDRLENLINELDLDRSEVYLVDDEHEYLRQAETMGINPIHISRLIGMIERGERI